MQSSLCLAFQWRLLTFSPTFHLFSLSRDGYLSRPQYWCGRCVNHGYSLPHVSELCLDSTRQASFGRFALAVSVCKYFCKGQAAEDLGTVTASLEMLRFLVFYSDARTSKAPHLHIKNEYVLCDGPVFLWIIIIVAQVMLLLFEGFNSVTSRRKRRKDRKIFLNIYS